MSEKLNMNKNLKHNPYSVPENYFNDFSSKLQSRILESENINNQHKIHHLFTHKFAYAASIIILFTMSYFTFNYLTTSKSELNNIQIAELIDEDYINFDDDDLFEFMVDNDIVIEDEYHNTYDYLEYEIDESLIYDEI